MSKNKFIILRNCVLLFTTKGEKFFIDKNMLGKVLKHTWCFSKTGYLVANIKKRVVKLHIFLYGKTNKGYVYDHINGEKSDNRSKNLRVCLVKENIRNSRLAKNNTTGHTGISKTPAGKYRARIMVDRIEIRLGHYENIQDALAARKAAELKYFKEFAHQGITLKSLAWR